MNAQVVMVTCAGVPGWIKVGVGSFLEHFPREQLIVVDNNLEACSETDWLQQHPDVIRLPGNPDRAKRSHGDGLDIAATWCRDHSIDVMTHIEPDCLISSKAWRMRLEYQIIERDMWVAGSHWQKYGPIHPCPGSWFVPAIRHTFALSLRADDRHHPRYAELFDEDELFNSCTDYEWEHIFKHSWDTAQKNWFHAACYDKVALIPAGELRGFKHFWKGRLDSTDERIKSLGPEVSRYLD